MSWYRLHGLSACRQAWLGPLRWDPCIAHTNADAEEFLRDYLSSSERHALLIGGAGFDPRSCRLARLLSGATANVRGLFIKENRPTRTLDQSGRADANVVALRKALPRTEIAPIDIFEGENAVVGGRNVVRVLEAQSLGGVTDIMVDISALSVGVSFPAIRYLWERHLSGGSQWNLHLLVSHDPSVDVSIRSTPGETIGYVRGFKGGITLSGPPEVARLWLPQLAKGRVQTLRQLYSSLKPHDVCPVLPFPASDPRLGDELIEEYMVELENAWSVDARNLVYASEADPLDLYRTILRLDDRRQPVFHGVGGTILVLTVVGSKVMALGALMAALERDLPVLHLEPNGYDLLGGMPNRSDRGGLMHIWLEGDAYPQQRPERVVRGTWRG